MLEGVDTSIMNGGYVQVAEKMEDADGSDVGWYSLYSRGASREYSFSERRYAVVDNVGADRLEAGGVVTQTQRPSPPPVVGAATNVEGRWE